MAPSFDQLKEDAKNLPPNHPIWIQIREHQELIDVQTKILLDKQRTDRASGQN